MKMKKDYTMMMIMMMSCKFCESKAGAVQSEREIERQLWGLFGAAAPVGS